MRALLETKKLLKILSNAQGYIIPRKATLPIITMVCLKIPDDKRLIVLSTDLENNLIEVMKVETTDYVKTKGYCVDAKLLIGLLSKIASATILMDFQATSIKVIANDNNYTLPFLDAKDFPTFAEIKEEQMVNFEIQTAVLKNYFQKALPFVGNDTTRPIMSSIHLVIKNKTIKIEATDSIKILQAVDEFPLELNADINIPTKFAVVFNKIYEHETVIINADNNRIDAVGMDFQLSCRLIEGKYPNTEPLFAQVRENKVTFKKDELLGAIERTLLFSNQLSTGIAFNISLESIVLEAADKDHQLSANGKVNAQCNSHDPFRIGLAGKHFDVCLSAFRSEEVSLLYKDTKQIVLFEDHLNAVHVLLAPIMI